MKADCRAGRSEGHRVTQKIVQNLHDPAILNRHPHRRFGQFGCQLVAVDGGLPSLDEIADKVTKINGRGGLCRHFVIDPA